MYSNDYTQSRGMGEPYPVSGSRPYLSLGSDCRLLSNTVRSVLEQVEYLGNLKGCVPLAWHWRSQQVGDVQELVLAGMAAGKPVAARHAAEQWAGALELDASERAHRGTIQFEGKQHDVRIEVWAVVDEKRFHGGMSYRTRACVEATVAGAVILSAAAHLVLAWRSGVAKRLVRAIWR